MDLENLSHKIKINMQLEINHPDFQKHRVELKRARALVDYLNKHAYELNPKFSPIKYQVIKLDGLTRLLDSALIEGGDEVPEGHYAEENMKATVVPNRNKIFASIT